MSMNRRKFIKCGALAGAAASAAVAAPHVATAQAKTFNWKMTNAYGPGQHFAAGELIPALEHGVIDAAEFVEPYQDRSPPSRGRRRSPLRSVAPVEVPTLAIYKGVVPFILLQLITLVVVYMNPGIATWLPRAIGW